MSGPTMVMLSLLGLLAGFLFLSGLWLLRGKPWVVSRTVVGAGLAVGLGLLLFTGNTLGVLLALPVMLMLLAGQRGSSVTVHNVTSEQVFSSLEHVLERMGVSHRVFGNVIALADDQGSITVSMSNSGQTAVLRADTAKGADLPRSVLAEFTKEVRTQARVARPTMAAFFIASAFLTALLAAWAAVALRVYFRS